MLEDQVVATVGCLVGHMTLSSLAGLEKQAAWLRLKEQRAEEKQAAQPRIRDQRAEGRDSEGSPAWAQAP